MVIAGLYLISSLLSLLAAVPASTNFTLKDFDFGTGGVSSSSSSYNLNGTVGTQTGANQANGVTILSPGEKPTQNANVPPAAALSNPTGTYNKLHLVLNTGSNPTDTRFAISISSDGFVTTKYVQTDASVGATFAIGNYQTYGLWGGATGFDILGLTPNTSYAVKVSAYQGAYTASAFGPASTAVATQPTTVSFSVATSANSTPPFNVNFASLSAGTVYTTNANALITLTTNAAFGGAVYISDTNTGLNSPTKSYTITSSTADLAVASSGYGAQVSTLSQTSGGPFTATSPYNGSVSAVGQLSPTLQQILGLTSPISGGSAQIKFLAKTAVATPAATDYTDSQTIVAAMTF